MRINTLQKFLNAPLSLTHRVTFHNIDVRNPVIKDGSIFNKKSDLVGNVSEDFGDSVVKAISSFGVNGVTVDSIECGPVITRVNLKLPRGIRIKSVSDLANDLAMQLRVASVSFTQNPQNGVLSLDVPAEERKVVLPGNIADVDVSKMALPLDLGVTVTGTARSIDLAKTPHLLIAGQTGSGKSVCINSIIMSLLRHVSMNDFDMMLIDPKGVELGMYATLPNVINKKVLVSSEESMVGLRWLVDEMERRYAHLSKSGHRNIGAYNEWVKTQSVGPDCAEQMRYIVCVVDEFADLMMTSGPELTQLVQLLAQKSRAVGIHIILATQRPSVKVVTGDLKANLPTRIAFKVSSATDSSTILGHGGAEHLLGMGDMILHTDAGEERLHGVYFDDATINSMFYATKFAIADLVDRTVDYATGAESYADSVPSWLMETIRRCDTRQLSANTPSWVAQLVRFHKAVWTTGETVSGVVTSSDKTLGVFVQLMLYVMQDVEAVRKEIEPKINNADPRCINVRDLSFSASNGMKYLVRMPMRALNGYAVYQRDFDLSAIVNRLFRFDLPICA